jgi:hypothetical protein
MSTKKIVLASLIVSCIAMAGIVEARGGTGGNGGNMGRAGRSDGSSGGIGSGSSSGCSSCGGGKSHSYEQTARISYDGYKSHTKKSCPVKIRGRASDARVDHSGDLIRKGDEARDHDVQHDPR